MGPSSDSWFILLGWLNGIVVYVLICVPIWSLLILLLLLIIIRIVAGYPRSLEPSSNVVGALVCLLFVHYSVRFNQFKMGTFYVNLLLSRIALEVKFEGSCSKPLASSCWLGPLTLVIDLCYKSFTLWFMLMDSCWCSWYVLSFSDHTFLKGWCAFDVNNFSLCVIMGGVVALWLDHWLSSSISLGLVGRLVQVIICWKVGSVRPCLCFKFDLLRCSLLLGY